jgi:PKD repeat protein
VSRVGSDGSRSASVAERRRSVLGLGLSLVAILGVVCGGVGLVGASTQSPSTSTNLAAPGQSQPVVPAPTSSVTAATTTAAEADAQPTSIEVSSSTVKIGTEVQFSAAGGADVERFAWSFGDGRFGMGRQVNHSYTEPGTYTVTLTTTDDAGTTTEYTTEVTVERAFANVVEIREGETVHPPNDTVSVYGISVTAGDSLSVVAGPSSVGLQSLLLYSPSGTRLDESVVPTESTAIGATATASGTYYVVADAFRFGRPPSVQVEFVTPDGFEPNQEPSSATHVEPNTSVEGSITDADTEDWFAFEAGPGNISVEARVTLNATNQNAVGVEVYDAAGDRIGRLDEFESNTSYPGVGDKDARQEARAPESGTYYVRVHRADSYFGSGPSEYELTVNVTEDAELPPVCAECDPPGDLDGDGTYEDVNGNGVVGFGDVVTLFENLDSDAVTENTARYDYDDSGDVGFGDVVSLFDTI